MPESAPVPVPIEDRNQDLPRIQKRFLDWLLQGDRSFAADVADGGRIPLDTRLAIYRNAYVLRLVEALADSYPALHTLVGDDAFDALARAYIELHPSTYRSIRWFGDRMADFLRRHPPYREQPVLAEMAAFEWALRGAFDAADTPSLAREVLAALPSDAWAGLRFAFHPSLSRLDLSWNAPRLWQAIDAGEAPILPEENPHPIGWLVWRNDLRTWFRSLEVDEAWAIDRMREGTPFAEVCAGLTEWIDEDWVPERAAGFVAQWLGDGLIVAVDH